MTTGDPVSRVAGDRPTQRTLVIIPTYNERENLPLILQRLQQARPDVHVLVVDDNSPDGTGQLAEELASADPDRIHVMHRTVKDAGADLVIGSRYVNGGDVQNWPWRRWALSWTANTYARLALGIGIHDITAGYRAYRREVLQKIDLDAVDSKGYCFQIDLTWRAINNGFVVVEVPITFTERELGVSKMSGSNIREALVKVAQWGIDGRLHRNRAVPVNR
jgi:dolichol-phosphate mannosyltransferase